MKSSWRTFASVASLHAALFLILSPLCMAQTVAPTATTLTISPSSSVSAGTVLTLTATVTSGGSSVHTGLVIFCNAAAAHCLDAAILGQAQVTSAGTATLRTRLRVGSHSIKAVFQGTPRGTPALSASTSSIQALNVTESSGSHATNTTVSAYGGAGNYTFIGAVLGLGELAPTGTVSFLDTTDGDNSLGSAALGSGVSPGFAQVPTPFTQNGATDIAVADFNGDGILDIASLGFLTSPSYPDYVTGTEVDYGNGDGTFRYGASVLDPDATDYPSAIRVSDFNSDEIPDIAVLSTNDEGQGTVSVLGTNYFVGQLAAVNLGPAADFNGDGIPDLPLLTYNNTLGGYFVTVLLGKPDGTFKMMSTHDASLVDVNSMVTGDFNGDGLADLAIAVEGLTDAESSVAILLSNGDGTFTPEPTISVGGFPSGIAEGDFNGDGILDLVTANQSDGTLSVLTGHGDGTFSVQTTPRNFPAPGTVVTGDFNGDGITDLAVNDYQANTEIILAGKGDGTFAIVSTTSIAPQGPPPAPADFNSDGVTDLFTSNQSAEIILLSGLEARAGLSGVSLGAGNHNIIARYSGDTHSAASDSAPLNIVNTTGGPQFAPKPGTYTYTQNVRLTDPTPGATIYYTLDGTQPTTASARYTAPIEISWQATINAIAVSPGAASSSVSSGAYLIERQLTSPAFAPASGLYVAPFTFRLTNSSADCTPGSCVLYYSVNSGVFTKYTGPVTINQFGTTTVKAIATELHYTTSAPSEATYFINPPY